MGLNKDVESILDPLLFRFDDELAFSMNGHLASTYISGQAEMITWGKTKGGIPSAYEGPPISQAVNWAKQHLSKVKLVDGINAETKKQLSKVIADGIANKRGIPGIKSDIRHKLNWMARGAPSDIKGLTLASRAELIARTETANALSAASLDTMADMGIDGKEWVTVGDDRVSDECVANEAQGVIAVRQAFTSGPMAPPQHPDCRCAVSPARLAAGAAPAGPTEGKIKEQISEFAGRTRTSEIEHMSAFDSMGNMVLTKAGSKTSVSFTKAEVAKLRNVEVFVHNHPRSTPFSIDDILFAHRINAKKVVVTSKEYRYTATPFGKTWEDPRVLKRLWSSEMKRLFPQAIKIFKDSGQDAADKWLFHNMWQAIEKREGIKYVREVP